ncbi:hypothetical protein KKI24_29425 [bacterium]|nr:hypothetical protein [bacterium]
MAGSESLNNLEKDYPELAAIFENGWHTPLKDFAGKLFQKAPRKIEPELMTAFSQELASMGYDPPMVQTVLDQLRQMPVLQTSHHITPTHGPTFLALDLMCLSGLQPFQLYLVGANSGVAFSNSAWSGALSYGSLPLERLCKPGTDLYRQALKSDKERVAHGSSDSRISLIPSRQRDNLVFNTPLTEYQTRLFQKFSSELQTLLPEMSVDRPYSQWSALAAAQIQNMVFGTRQVLIFDINRVVSRYLVSILSNQPDHPCGLLLSNTKESAHIRTIFGDPPMFLGCYQGKKTEKVDPLFWKGQGLESLKTGYEELSRLDLIRKLEDNRVCPGIFLLFFVLRFLNGLRCLGSFSQIGYLERFRRQWGETNLNWDLDLEPDYQESLTTGRLYRGGNPVWPLDLALEQEQLSVKTFSHVEMGHFWEPIVKQLTHTTP